MITSLLRIWPGKPIWDSMKCNGWYLNVIHQCHKNLHPWQNQYFQTNAPKISIHSSQPGERVILVTKVLYEICAAWKSNINLNQSHTMFAIAYACITDINTFYTNTNSIYHISYIISSLKPKTQNMSQYIHCTWCIGMNVCFSIDNGSILKLFWNFE